MNCSTAGSNVMSHGVNTLQRRPRVKWKKEADSPNNEFTQVVVYVRSYCVCRYALSPTLWACLLIMFSGRNVIDNIVN